MLYRQLLSNGTPEGPHHPLAATVPGHQIKVDVKSLTSHGKYGKLIRRYQYTVIDDTTRVKSLKIFTRHT